jgi:hypothetical protein
VHDGLYLRFAAGPAFAGLAGTTPAGGDASVEALAVSGLVAAGGTLPHGIVLGGLLQLESGRSGNPQGWGPGKDSASFVMGTVQGFIDWYPRPEGGWHFGGGWGIGYLATDLAGPGLGALDVAISTQGGYEWWIADQWSAGLLLRGTITTESSMLDGDHNETGYKMEGVSLGLYGTVLLH